MAHTPGPWEHGSLYYPKDGTIGSCEITQSGGMGILAKVNLPAEGRDAHKEGPANARLIAAAPELLEALEILLSWVENWDVPFLDDEEWPESEAKIKAAIAKARGTDAT